LGPSIFIFQVLIDTGDAAVLEEGENTPPGTFMNAFFLAEKSE